MLREVTEDEALRNYQKGQEVIVIEEKKYSTGYECKPLGEVLQGKKFLVDDTKTAFEEKYETLAQKLGKPLRQQAENSEGGVTEGSGEPTDEKPKKTSKKIDTGKIMALHRAGWTGKAIAEEMGISEPTVSKYIKQLK